jgi:Amt family ammonium transporter
VEENQESMMKTNEVMTGVRQRTARVVRRWWLLMGVLAGLLVAGAAEGRAQDAAVAPAPAAEVAEGNGTDLRATVEGLQKEIEATRVAVEEAKSGVGGVTISANIMWTLLTGFLVMFMQAGFAMVETGFTRKKNAVHTMSMNFMVYAIGMLGFWFSGFALMFGGTGDPRSASPVGTLGPEVAKVLDSSVGFTIFGKYFGIAGNEGFFLSGECFAGSIFTLFLFQMVFMDTTATIPTGSMAERWKFLPFCLFSFAVGAIIYPLYGMWVWGGGWLATLGKNFGLGHGHVDFAGSSVVHLCGGTLALVCGKLLGPRIGKFNEDGSPNPIPGHNIPMAFIGSFVLAFGWFGFNAGSTLAGTDAQIGIIATNTMLAGAAGALASMIITWMKFGRPDPSFLCNGMLAGLVAITAPCAFVDSWAAIMIGAVAGVLVLFSAIFVEEKLKIDDPVGAFSVHGANGCWGVLALGLFANGKYGEGWNGVAGKVTGFFYGDASQFVAQFIGALTCVLYVAVAGYCTFRMIGTVVAHRSAPEDELGGLDIPEMGAVAYPDDV